MDDSSISMIPSHKRFIVRDNENKIFDEFLRMNEWVVPDR